MPDRREHIVIDPADRAWLARLGLNSVHRVMEHRPSSIAAMSGSSETFAVDVEAGPDAPQLIYVKRYRYRGFGARLKGMFRGTLFGTSRARFEYEFLDEMRRRRVPGVRPIAYGEGRRAGFLAACFLITEGEVGAKSLDAYAGEHEHPRYATPRQRRRFIDALAPALRGMHRAGVMHGGLFWRNILVADTVEGGWRFHLIDPDRRGRLHQAEVPREGVVSDLADFAATSASFSRRTDLIRFARAYFDKLHMGDAEKGLLREIVAAAAGNTVQEEHRVAVGHTIEWLTRRIQQAGGGRRFDNVAAFFEHVGAKGRADVNTDKGVCILLVFQAGAITEETETYTLTNCEGRLRITQGPTGEADLTVQTDAETWLAIVNGQPNAFDLIRAGRLTITGDTNLLPFLIESIGRYGEAQSRGTA